MHAYILFEMFIIGYSRSTNQIGFFLLK